MNTPVRTNTSHPQSSGVNPFARALAEARTGQTDQTQTSINTRNTALPQMNNGALGESGDFDAQTNQSNQMEEQRRLFEQQQEQQKRERLRQQLHRQINPIETNDIFNAKEQQVKKEIDNIRHELTLLSREITEFNKDVEVSLMANVASPGTEGKYYLNFFQKLREFIILLRKKVHSARTWATTMTSKKKKRRGAGLEISGKNYEQTATIFDQMHHERSTAYSGS